MFNLPEQCVTQGIVGRQIIMFHIVYDVKPLVVEGLKLVISILVEHIQMMGIVENFSVVR